MMPASVRELRRERWANRRAAATPPLRKAGFLDGLIAALRLQILSSSPWSKGDVYGGGRP